MLTSIVCVKTSSLILSITYCFGCDSEQNQKLAAVFILPRMCAIVKLNCRTKFYAFHNGCAKILVWQNSVTDLPSVKITTGFGFPQNKHPVSLGAKYFARNSLA